MKFKQFMAEVLGEGVEQIDELSQDTLTNYHAKAGADLQKKRKKLMKGKLTSSEYKKGRNRAQGLNRSADKMKEEVENLEEGPALSRRRISARKMNSISSYLHSKKKREREEEEEKKAKTKNESVEQIDEISSNTALEYGKRASKQNINMHRAQKQDLPKDVKDSMVKKSAKRKAGIENAKKRMTNRDNQKLKSFATVAAMAKHL